MKWINNCAGLLDILLLYFGDIGYYEWRLFWSEFMGTIMQDKAIWMLAGRAKLPTPPEMFLEP